MAVVIATVPVSYAWALFLAGRYAEAVSRAQAALRQQPDYLSALRIVAAGSALTDRLTDARKAIALLHELDPEFRISNIEDRDPLRRPENLAKFAEGLRKAGLPE